MNAAVGFELEQVAHEAVLIHQVFQILRQTHLMILGKAQQVVEDRLKTYPFGPLLFLLR